MEIKEHIPTLMKKKILSSWNTLLDARKEYLFKVFKLGLNVNQVKPEIKSWYSLSRQRIHSKYIHTWILNMGKIRLKGLASYNVHGEVDKNIN